MSSHCAQKFKIAPPASFHRDGHDSTLARLFFTSTQTGTVVLVKDALWNFEMDALCNFAAR